jgi:hypothetical protein
MITSGSVTVGTGGPGTFDLAADTFGASGGFSPSGGFWGVLSNPFQTGSTISVNGRQCCNDLSGANVTIGSEIYAVDIHDLQAQKGSWINFVGPDITLDRGAGVYESTFSFTGAICGTIGGPGIRPCLVDLPDLTGFGTVRINVVSVLDSPPNRQLFNVTNATYFFSVPEPATWPLLLFGLVGLSIARANRKVPRGSAR